MQTHITAEMPLPKPATLVGSNSHPIAPRQEIDACDYVIKSWPQFFDKMIKGIKKHDMRDKRDRDYKVGDRVLLCEFDPFGGGYTGRYGAFMITYITSNDTPCAMSSAALDNNFAILSMELIHHGELVR